MSDIAIPQLCLVALVGVSGSGKSTFAARHFGPYEVLSSDVCRGMVRDDENDQDATKDAFDVLGYIAGKRLAAGRLTVVDATNVSREARRQLVELARAHDVLPVAIVLDVPVSVAVARNEARPDRNFGERVVRRHHDQLRRSLRGLQREGFRVVHTLSGVEEIEAAQVVRERLSNDLRDEHGPFDVIGDVHGCLEELLELLGELGYEVVRDAQGRAVDARHPEGRRVVFVGDLVDRGPDSVGVLRLAMGMTGAGHALAVPGNHENKLIRALDGRDVRVSHGLETTLAELAGESEDFRREVRDWCYGLVSHLVLDDGRLVVAHAGLKEEYHGRASGRVRSFALYGDTTGETDEYGLPVRLPWARDYRGSAMVLYGHVPTPEPEWINRTMCLDTGCVFGGRLTALRYPEKEIVQVSARQVWYEPSKPFAVDAGAESHAERPDDVLELTDVLGKRVVDTAHRGRVSIGADQAAGALEVMSRFALPPSWLGYLPPTMAPAATPEAAGDGLLEHPEGAFADFAKDGVSQVICEEKHMGSRAVVVLCRSAQVAAARFGGDGAQTGAVYTRTGRAFLDPAATQALLARLRAAADRVGLWSELGTDWLLLDAELLPWSLKAEGLLRDQFASVAASAGAALPAAAEALEAFAARGVTSASGASGAPSASAAEAGELLTRIRERADAATAFAAAYRRYRWPTGGDDPLTGVRLAPFQLLAGEGVTWADRDHLWHLGIIDRLVEADASGIDARGADVNGADVMGAHVNAADPSGADAKVPDASVDSLREPLLQTTRRLVVDLGDPASRAEGVTWWEEFTAAGGEGMVVKPLANLSRGSRGLVQPGLKVRGPEYLRLVYGPDYTRPEHLARLRDRNLGRKRSLALREYALGLEALTRLASGEPLWRVHEVVFAILALESDPVDPRL